MQNKSMRGSYMRIRMQHEERTRGANDGPVQLEEDKSPAFRLGSSPPGRSKPETEEEFRSKLMRGCCDANGC